jgi:hypothetical protein
VAAVVSAAVQESLPSSHFLDKLKLMITDIITKEATVPASETHESAAIAGHDTPLLDPNLQRMLRVDEINARHDKKRRLLDAP